MAFVASRVTIPARAPQIRAWFVPRQEVVRETCRLLRVYSDSDSAGEGEGAEAGGVPAVANGDSGGGCDKLKEEPRPPPPPPVSPVPAVVGLAGPAGCGKSTAAAMVIAREEVRGYFHEGVVWLPVGGRGAKHRIPEVMMRLASLVHEQEVKRSRSGESEVPPPPPRRQCVATDRHESAAFVRAVLGPHPTVTGTGTAAGGVGSGSEKEKAGDSSGGGRGRRYLIVADDVYEREVLEEIKGVGACVLYTTTRSASGMRYGGGGGGDLLRLDDLHEEEAEIVLRRACGLDRADAALPQPALDMMKSYGSVVMDINYVGRWGVVRERADAKAWDVALNRIFIEAEAGDGGGDEGGEDEGGDEGGEERWTRRRWHTAVILAGFADLGRLNDRAKDLYLYLAVLPRGLGFKVRQDET